MCALLGAQHRRQPQGVGGCDLPAAVLGSCSCTVGKALPNLLLPDPSLLVRAHASVVFSGCSCRFLCAACA